MAIDVTDLSNKIHNEGDTAQGRLSADEFNRLVNAVVELQSSGVQSITVNNGEVKFRPDDTGNINLMISESNYNLSMTTTVSGNPPYNIALNGEFMMHVKVLNKFIDGDTASDTYTACKADFYCNNSIVYSREVYDKEEFDFNWGPYLSEGKNIVYVKVDNNFGEVKTSNPVEINAIFIQLDIVNFNDLAIKTGDSWPLDVRIIGTSANIHISIDGNEIINAYQSAGSTVTYNITEGLTTGTHILEAYAISDINTTVRTNVISYEYIYSVDGFVNPIIASELRDNHTIQLYNILKVVYWVYCQNFTGTKTVSLTLFDDLNPSISSSTQEITLENGISKKYTFDVVLFDNSLIGPKKIKLSVDNEERIIPIVVEEPEYELKQIEGFDLYLSSAGKDNKDSNYKDWSYGDYKVTFSDDIDFTDTGSGWINDPEGNKALHLRKGKYVSLNYQPFATNPAYGNNSDIPGTKKGLTFSIELATRNCINRDASVVRCMYNGIGFEFFANKMVFQNSVQSMSADYKEDTRVRIDLVIEGSPITYTYYDYNDKTYKTSEEARMIVYIDGVYQQMLLLSEYSNFKQEIPQDIEIGSEYCDIDIYCIRGYKSALDFKSIVDNYSFDTPVVADKIKIAKRCNVFDSKLNVTYKGLQEARPELPILIISMKDLPTSKNRLPVSSTSYTNPLNPDNYEQGNASFNVGAYAEMGNQGTSSMNYPMPYRNFDWRISKSSIEKPFIIGGAGYKKYPMYLGMPPIKKFTFKKDYASSEMANNAICSAIITDMACGICENYPNVLTVAMQDAVAQGKSPNTYRLGLKAIPMFMFNYYNNEYTPLGMFNFIPNKNEQEYLGFTDTKLHNFTFESSRAQSWEIRDNNIFWDFYLNPTGKDSEGNIVNDVFRYYEAIYPKDNTAESGDFGEIKNESDINNAINETKDLLILHNWLVDTNQLCATGALLKEPYIDSTGRTFDYDTAEYRRAKFMSEHKDHIILDSWILYYIWREQFWMMDSGSKNLQIHTFDGIHWGAHVRDADTGLGTDNEGKLVFPHYLEDVDFRDNETNNFIFNQSVQPDNSSTVLNGQLGSIWINIRDCYKDRIQEIYNALITNGEKTKFGYDYTIKYFEDHQNQWSEALYNFGSKQYYGGTPYSKWISSGLGDKKNQRRYWLYYGFRYRMSKYHAGSGVNRITWRTFGRGSDLLIKPYCELYVCLGFGTYDYKTTKRYRCLNPSEGVLVKNEYTQNVTDNVCYLFNGDLITDMGNLYEFGDIGSLDLTVAKRLRYLRVGNNKNKVLYSNSQLTDIVLTNCESLEYIDFTNCTGFGTGSGQNGIFTLQLQNQSLLQEFYASGASMTGIIFPETPSLRIIELGDNLTSLDIQNLIGLESFSLDGGSKIQTLKMSNSGKISSEQSYNILVQIFSGENVLKNVDIRGINWTNASGEIIEKLCDLKANLTGKINMLYVGQMTYALKSKLVKQYGNIDDPNNPLYITYKAEAIDSLKLQDKIYYSSTGEYDIEFSVSNSKGNNFIVNSIQYTLEDNLYSTIDSKTGKLTVNKIGEENEDGTGPHAKLTITMRAYSVDANGNLDINTSYEITAESELNFWNKTLKIGDIIYADGFVSSAKDYQMYVSQGKFPIGVCFYIDEKNPDLKLMFSLKTVSLMQSLTIWGPTMSKEYGIPNLSLSDENSNINVYDIQDIPNFPSTGLDAVLPNNYTWNDMCVYDGEQYNFVKFPNSTAAGSLGFMTVDSNKNGYMIGDVVPVGKYYTSAIIYLRNKVLTDSNVSRLGLRIPVDNYNGNGETEFNDLYSLVEKSNLISSDFGKLYNLYFPGISACYAFQPTYSSVIIDKYKAHNWFIPASGDLTRIGYYLYLYATKNTSVMNKFKPLFENNVLTESFFTDTRFMSINESSYYNSYDNTVDRSWAISLDMFKEVDGKIYGFNLQGAGINNVFYPYSKYMTMKILPICQI